MGKFCKNCGSPLGEGEAFCGNCGAAVSDEEAGGFSGERVTENIVRCEDGRYRWYYELRMMKNPTVLFTVWKVLGISFGIVWLIGAFAAACDSVDIVESLWGTTKVFLIIMGVFFVISLLAYFIVAAVYGFKYIVLFTMDEDGVVHEQCGRQVKKAEAIGWITAMVGIAAGKPYMVGLGMNTAVRSSTASEFAYVRSVRLRPRRSVIYLSQGLSKNQVYAEPGDYGFVAEFVKAHCRNAKIR